MILGIDASNIRGGGGLTHVSELLGAAAPERFGFDRVVIWASAATLERIHERPWLSKRSDPWLDRSLPWRLAWKILKLSGAIGKECCDITFVPGGSYVGQIGPVVSMSQNLLPFDWIEIRRFGISLFALKMWLLRLGQSRAFRRADGVIFLTRGARDAVGQVLGELPRRHVIVHHGIDQRFRLEPRPQQDIQEYSPANPFRLLYVSDVWPYKHPWTVVEAVARLRAKNYPVRLDVVGGGYAPSIRRLKETIDRFDSNREFLCQSGSESHDKISIRYHQAQLFVFASSCETFGQIVTEAMSAGLPIVCSNRAAMPELLQDAGKYFDPEDADGLAEVLREVIDSPDLRSRMAWRGYHLAQSYSWHKCADETMAFIEEIAKTSLPELGSDQQSEQSAS